MKSNQTRKSKFMLFLVLLTSIWDISEALQPSHPTRVLETITDHKLLGCIQRPDYKGDSDIWECFTQIKRDASSFLEIYPINERAKKIAPPHYPGLSLPTAVDCSGITSLDSDSKTVVFWDCSKDSGDLVLHPKELYLSTDGLSYEITDYSPITASTGGTGAQVGFEISLQILVFLTPKINADKPKIHYLGILGRTNDAAIPPFTWDLSENKLMNRFYEVSKSLYIIELVTSSCDYSYVSLKNKMKNGLPNLQIHQIFSIDFQVHSVCSQPAKAGMRVAAIPGAVGTALLYPSSTETVKFVYLWNAEKETTSFDQYAASKNEYLKIQPFSGSTTFFVHYHPTEALFNLEKFKVSVVKTFALTETYDQHDIIVFKGNNNGDTSIGFFGISPSGENLQIFDEKYEECQENCQACYQTSPNSCMVCSGPEYALTDLTNGTGNCIKEEKRDRNYPNFLGVECSAQQLTDHCLYCGSPDYCSQCDTDNGGWKVTEEGTCVTSCKLGETSTKANACQKCSSTCLTCGSSPTECLSCPNGITLQSDNTCKAPVCAGNEFLSLLGTCESTCESCSDLCFQSSPSPDGCGTNLCTKGEFYYRSVTNNITSDPSNKICQECSEGCSACATNPNDCTECDSGYLLLGKECYKSLFATELEVLCPAGLYKDTLECKKCNISCVECDNATHCTKCKTNQAIGTAEGQFCVDCFEGTFLDKEDNQCKKCYDKCKTCTQIDACINCKPGFKLYGDSCISTCPSGFKASKGTEDEGGLCIPSDEASTCQTETADGCTSCYPGEYSNEPSTGTYECLEKCPKNKTQTNPTCSDCQAPCSECAYLPTQCLACLEGKFILDGTCVEKCPTQMTQTPTNGICQHCEMDNCTLCGNDPSDCLLTCPSNKVMRRDGSCQTYCPDGETPVGIFRKCVECVWPCDKCAVGNPFSCTTCQSDFYLLNERCLAQCPHTYTSSPTNFICVPCITNCLTCSTTNKICTSCIDTYALNGTRCYNTKCPGVSLYTNVWKNGLCVPCLSPCRTCSSKTNYCKSCEEGYYLYSGDCLKDCNNALRLPIGTYQICLGKCSEIKCEICSQYKTNCLKCVNGYYLINGKCVYGCPAGYSNTTDKFACVKCLDNCDICYTNGNQCKTCSPDFYGTSKLSYPLGCSDKCPGGLGYNAYYKKCYPCLARNLECDDSGVQGAFTCEPTYPLYEKTPGFYSCYPYANRCPYYQGIRTVPIEHCYKCRENCKTCVDDPNVCTGCYDPYNLYEGLCDLYCPFGTYSYGLKCKACSADCKSCTSTTRCKACFPPKVLQGGVCKDTCDARNININGYCIPCQTYCDVCNPLDPVKCTTCRAGYYIYEDYCYKGCPRGFGVSSDGKSCEACPADCLVCVTSSTCSICEGEKLGEGATCVDECSDGYFLDKASNLCVICSSECETCQGNGKNCILCKPPFLKRGNRCLSVCLMSEYSDGTTCHKCNEACLGCTGPGADECKFCPDNYYRTPIDGSPGVNECKKSCSDTPIDNYSQYPFDGICPHPCPADCKKCDGRRDTCTECDSGSVLYRGRCLSACPKSTYETTDHVCFPCRASCLSCTSEHVCTSCASSKRYKPDTNTCHDTCPLGYTQNETRKYCLPCESNCLECSNSPSRCSTCKTGQFLYTYKCFDTCPTKQVGLTYGNKLSCRPCIGYCAECLESNPAVCLSCPSTLFLTAERTCVSKCGPGKIGIRGHCVDCNESCATCTTTPNKCYTCHLGSFLVNYDCLPQCPLGTYVNASDPSKVICSKCSGSCVSCEGNASNCQRCQPGLFLKGSTCSTACSYHVWPNPVSGVCERNPANCEYKPSLELGCTKCYEGFFLHEGKCSTACPRGYYRNSGYKTCRICDPEKFCETCGTSSSNCLSCTANKMLQGATCVDACSSGYVANPLSGKCDRCLKRCSQCENTPSQCTSCGWTTYLSPNKLCVAQCEMGWTDTPKSGVCQECTDNCLTCYSETHICRSCKPGFHFNKEDDACLAQCPPGKVQDPVNNICEKCQKSCAQCLHTTDNCDCLGTSGDDCMPCFTSETEKYYKNGTDCPYNCPPKMTKSPPDQICRPCTDPNCLNCEGTVDNCVLCDAGAWFLEGTSCVAQCSAANVQTPDNRLCEPCTDGCTSCETYRFKCRVCDTPKLLYKDECYDTCLRGTYETGLTCTDCDETCRDCETSPTTCTKCKRGLLLSGSECIKTCPIHTVKNPKNLVCEPCEIGCERCDGRPGKCLECNSTYYLDYANKKCVETCPEGTYKRETGGPNNSKYCSNCSSHCKTCSAAGYSKCESCKEIGYIFHNDEEKSCRTECRVRYYNEKGSRSCLKCSEACYRCDGPEDTDCTQCAGSLYILFETRVCYSKCPEGYGRQYLNGRRTCEPCDPTCASCHTYNFRTCTRCEAPRFLGGNRCLLECPSGYYGKLKDDGSQICSKCSDTCQSCKGDATTCTSCLSGFYLSLTGDCSKICPEGEVVSEQGDICEQCGEYCSICEATTLVCQKCFSGFEIDNQANQNCLKLPDSPLKLVSSNFSKKKSTVTLKFDKEIKSKDFASMIELVLYDEYNDVYLDNKDNKYFSSTIKITEDKKGIDIYLTIFMVFEQYTLILRGTNSRTFEYNGPGVEVQDRRALETIPAFSFVGVDIQIKNINYVSVKDDNVSQAMETIKKIFKIILPIVSLIILIFLPWHGVMFVRQLILFDTLKFLNIEIAPGQIEFFESFETNIFTFIPNVFPQTDDIGLCDANTILEENDFSCLLLNTAGNYIIFYIILIFLKVIIKGLRLCLEKKQKKNGERSNSSNGSVEDISRPSPTGNQINTTDSQKEKKQWIIVLDKIYGKGFFYKVLMLTHLEPTISIIANLRSFNLQGFPTILNSGISALLFSAYIIGLFIFSKKMINLDQLEKKRHLEIIENSKKREEEEIEYENFNGKLKSHKINLKGGKKEEKEGKEEKETKRKTVIGKTWQFLTRDKKRYLRRTSNMINEILLVTDLILVIFVLAYPGMPYHQVAPAMILYILICALLIYTMPYDKLWKNLILIINGITFSAVLFGYLCLQIVGLRVSEKEKYHKIGFPIIFLVILTLGANLLIYSTLISLKFMKYCRKVKERRRTRKAASLEQLEK